MSRDPTGPLTAQPFRLRRAGVPVVALALLVHLVAPARGAMPASWAPQEAEAATSPTVRWSSFCGRPLPPEEAPAGRSQRQEVPQRNVLNCLICQFAQAPASMAPADATPVPVAAASLPAPAAPMLRHPATMRVDPATAPRAPPQQPHA